MKIAIMGAGALGCFVGGLLHKSGADVTFVARGATLEALKNGLEIRSPNVPAKLTGLKVAATPTECGPVDAIIFLVKLYDVVEAAKAMKPMIGPDTTVFSFQNGIDGPEMLRNTIGEKHVVPGIAYIPADIEKPGVMVHNGTMKMLEFGEFSAKISERCKAMEAVLKNADLDAVLTQKIETQLWEKFVIQSALSGITSLTRLTIGQIRDNKNCMEMFIAAIQEAQGIAEKIIPDFPKDCMDRKLDFSRQLAHDMRASMAYDLLAGKRLELDYMSGTIQKLGKKHGIPTPVQSVAYAALHPFIDGTPLR